MKVAIHQPEHLPWLGFFYKLLKSDLFVSLDHVQFEKGGWQNRNQLKESGAHLKWLTVPIQKKSYQDKQLDELLINNFLPWKRKYLKFIAFNYKSAPYFDRYFPEFEAIIERSYTKLVELNKEIISFFCLHLEISTPIISSSKFDCDLKRDALLLKICKSLGATSYLVGAGATNYLNGEFFAQENIEICQCRFEPPPFNGYLYEKTSTLDALFHLGPKTASFVREGQITSFNQSLTGSKQ